MKRRLTDESGSIANVLAVLFLLAIVMGVILFWQRRILEVDVGEQAESIAVDLGKMAEDVREESMDALTTTKVKAAFGLSKSVSAFEIDVDSDKGVVVLTGRLPSEEARATALRLAGDVSGVREVVDRLQVVPGVPPTLESEEVARRMADLHVKVAVYEALLRAPDVDASRIQVTVDDGDVVLEGYVSRREEVERSVAITASVRGALSVVNRLAVSPPAS